jgi:RNA polymerase sigma-70 factor (ECF subfamily)
MDDRDWLAERFEAHRAHLTAVAYRILGSSAEADDAVQESWLRLSRSDPSDIASLGGWLTTVVARVCLDMLRSRKARAEEPLDAHAAEPVAAGSQVIHPEEEALLGDSIGLALMVVLDTLAPAERLAFVLHDMFAVPFDEIASIVGRSRVAVRQLASRARRRVQGAAASGEQPLPSQRHVVEAFLAASREGDFEALVRLLDPDVQLSSDRAAVDMGAPEAARGSAAVAATFSGRARVAKPALVDGVPAAVWARGGQPRVLFTFTITNGTISAMEIVADPDRLRDADVLLLDG